jgi:hypothetical protein
LRFEYNNKCFKLKKIGFVYVVWKRNIF